MTETDYEPGDFPVPIGVEVEYFGSQAHGRYVVHGRVNVLEKLQLERPGALAEAYPDGAAYHLWPVGVPQKFGNRDQSVLFVRRTSFRVVEAGGVGHD